MEGRPLWPPAANTGGDTTINPLAQPMISAVIRVEHFARPGNSGRVR